MSVSTIALSTRVQSIKPSPTLGMAAKVRQLKTEGVSIIDLGVGEPDFDTPPHIKQAAIDAIKNGFTKYTAVEGSLDLRKVIIQKFEQDNQLHYEPNQILVSTGGKQSFFNLIQAFINPGDEVIIPAPYWVSYLDIVILAGGKPVVISADITQNFKIKAADLEKSITPKTKLLVLNSPSNPSGMAYTDQELKSIGAVLRKYPNLVIATDDMYEKILWSAQAFSNIVMACPDLYARTLVLHGVSKSYAMTGWRIGYAAGPAGLIQAMKSIQGQSTSGPCSISQMAAKAALAGDQSAVRTMVDAFKSRHDFLVPALNAIPGMECLESEGTFYAFPKVQKLMDRLGLKDDVALTEFLLDSARVAVIPGSAFGTPGHIRLSFATKLENLEDALKRLQQAILGT